MRKEHALFAALIGTVVALALLFYPHHRYGGVMTASTSTLSACAATKQAKSAAGADKTVVHINAAMGAARGRIDLNRGRPGHRDWRLYEGDFDGDGRNDVLMAGIWGIVIATCDRGKSRVILSKPSHSWISGRFFNTDTTKIEGVGDFDGDWRADILTTNTWGLAVLTLRESSLAVSLIVPNGAHLGSWQYSSLTDTVADITDINRDGIDDLILRKGSRSAAFTFANERLRRLTFTKETVTAVRPGSPETHHLP